MLHGEHFIENQLLRETTEPRKQNTFYPVKYRLAEKKKQAKKNQIFRQICNVDCRRKRKAVSAAVLISTLLPNLLVNHEMPFHKNEE